MRLRPVRRGAFRGFATMTGSLMAATRALYCCADAHVADAAVLGSGEAGEEGGFSALISSLADETALSERSEAQCEFARLGRELASPSANLRPCQESAIRLRGLVDNLTERATAALRGTPAAAVRTRPSATNRTAGSTMNDPLSAQWRTRAARRFHPDARA
jgi:hypothetical protein